MIYPQDFIDRCKLAIPNYPVFHEMLDKGNPFVGRILDDSRGYKIPLSGPESTYNPTVQDLYGEWWELIREWNLDEEDLDQ